MSFGEKHLLLFLIKIRYLLVKKIVNLLTGPFYSLIICRQLSFVIRRDREKYYIKVTN